MPSKKPAEPDYGPVLESIEGLWGWEPGTHGEKWNLQLRVHAQLPQDGRYIVQLYSAGDGTRTNVELWSADRLAGCQLYRTHYQWRYSMLVSELRHEQLSFKGQCPECERLGFTHSQDQVDNAFDNLRSFERGEQD
jgi:hypothetical protein